MAKYSEIEQLQIDIEKRKEFKEYLEKRYKSWDSIFGNFSFNMQVKTLGDITKMGAEIKALENTLTKLKNEITYV